MTRAAGSGSRARSREIGYADAMQEVGMLLRAEARKWRGSAEQQLHAEWRSALNVAAGQLEQVADFAAGAAQLHFDARGDFAWNIGHLDYLERKWGHAPAPRELPARDDARDGAE